RDGLDARRPEGIGANEMQQGIGIQLKADPVRNAICSCREEQGSARAKRTRAPVGSKEVGDLPDLIGVESPEIKNLGECRCRGPLRSRDSLSANFTQILCEFWAPMLICRAAAKVKIPRR